MTVLLDRCGPFDIGPGPEWYRELADWTTEPEPEPPVTLRCQHCHRLTAGQPLPPPEPLDGLFRQLLDVIAGECRRAGMLP